MSDEPDRERVRALIAELDKVQRESERVRARIAEIRQQGPKYPDEADDSASAETPGWPRRRRS